MDSNLQTLLEGENYTDFGFTALKTPPTIEKYKDWIEQSFHGTMNFMADHTPFKEFPQSLFKNCLSAIVVTQDYGETENDNFPLKNLRIAKYAQQKDYHHWFQEKLERTIKQLQLKFPSEVFIAAADSKPVLERDLAYRAGLGWIGKNTCLINSQKGSLFFIGEILTSLSLNSVKTTHPDRCGSCTKCIDHCPTGAILEPFVLDANKCISYLNIEKRGVIPPSLSSKMNDWFFGCDICQNVCPWNEKIYKADIKAEQVKTRVPTPEPVSYTHLTLPTICSV